MLVTMARSVGPQCNWATILSLLLLSPFVFCLSLAPFHSIQIYLTQEKDALSLSLPLSLPFSHPPSTSV